jgi:hypothetical protein
MSVFVCFDYFLGWFGAICWVCSWVLHWYQVTSELICVLMDLCVFWWAFVEFIHTCFINCLACDGHCSGPKKSQISTKFIIIRGYLWLFHSLWMAIKWDLILLGMFGTWLAFGNSITHNSETPQLVLGLFVVQRVLMTSKVTLNLSVCSK